MIKEIMKRIAVLALSGTMTLGMSVSVLAEGITSNLNASRENISDTSTIYLIKDYVAGSENQAAAGEEIEAGKIPTESPEETFTFTITRYGLWNVGQDGNGQDKYSKDDSASNAMPTFMNGTDESATNSFTINAGKAAAENSNDLSVALTVPTYEAVGDYWYQVVETDNNIAGVIYGTNDNSADDRGKSNNGHDAVYYIHVQVTNGATKGNYIRTVTLHKTAPNIESVATNAEYEQWYEANNENTEQQPAKKINDIQNKYYAGQLNITKEVTGNAGDKNELFQVTVVFTNSSRATMNSDITYKNFYNESGVLQTAATSIGWLNAAADSTKTVSFYVKDGTTVTFDNIPYGVSYKITETQPRDDKYTHSFAYTDSDAADFFNGLRTVADFGTSEKSNWSDAIATGSISDDSDTVTITNDKESAIDIGVITSNAPYFTMLIFAAAVLVLFVHRRKNNLEEY